MLFRSSPGRRRASGLSPQHAGRAGRPIRDTKYVGVVAFYNKVGEEQTWKMLITKKQLTNKKPVVIELVDNKVLLQETVKKVK